MNDMETTQGFTAGPTAEQGGQRYSHDSTSALQHQRGSNTVADRKREPPFRIPVYIGYTLVLLSCLSLFIMNGIAGGRARALDVATSVPISALCFAWCSTNLLGEILLPSVFTPSRLFKAKLLVHLILTIGSWVCFGALLQRAGGSLYRGMFLALLVPLAGLMTLTALCIMIQKYKTVRGSTPHRFVQPAKQGGI